VNSKVLRRVNGAVRVLSRRKRVECVVEGREAGLLRRPDAGIRIDRWAAKVKGRRARDARRCKACILSCESGRTDVDVGVLCCLSGL